MLTILTTYMTMCCEHHYLCLTPHITQPTITLQPIPKFQTLFWIFYLCIYNNVVQRIPTPQQNSNIRQNSFYSLCKTHHIDKCYRKLSPTMHFHHVFSHFPFPTKHFSPHITHHISSTHVKFLHSLYHHTVPTQYDFFLTIFPPADLSLSLSPSLSHPFTSLILSPMGVVLELSPC